MGTNSATPCAALRRVSMVSRLSLLGTSRWRGLRSALSDTHWCARPDRLFSSHCVRVFAAGFAAVVRLNINALMECAVSGAFLIGHRQPEGALEICFESSSCLRPRSRRVNYLGAHASRRWRRPQAALRLHAGSGCFFWTFGRLSVLLAVPAGVCAP